MTKELSITDNAFNDNETNGDIFGKDNLVLARLNKLPDDYKTDDFVKKEDCTVKEEYLIKSKKEVFDSIYNAGKEFFELFQAKTFITMHEYFDDDNIMKKVKEIFNRYVYENGFPFLIGRISNIHNLLDDEPAIPNNLYFINECVLIYGIEELRKWIFKFRQQLPEESKNEIGSFPTNKFRMIYNIFKDYFISIIDTPTSGGFITKPIIDDFRKSEILELLNCGLPNKTNKILNQEEIDYYIKFLKALQRTLICTTLEEIDMIDQPIQYLVSKRLPIYNKKSKNYRLYTIAYSLLGIAFDYLLLNLTATRRSYERIICEVPDCNNEFEKVSKSNLCPYHQELNSKYRTITNHKYYIAHQDEIKKKKRKRYQKEKAKKQLNKH